jgi:hypothetical protein
MGCSRHGLDHREWCEDCRWWRYARNQHKGDEEE